MSSVRSLQATRRPRWVLEQMLRIGRTSDMAGVPMWIPHGAVALGFALILIVTVWRLIGIVRRSPETASEGQANP